MTHDLKQLRADAANMLIGGGDSEQWQRCQAVARAFLALADQTPLTVERLVEVGFKKWGARGQHYVRGSIGVIYSRFPMDDVIWYHETETEKGTIFPQPRTVGELRQLLLRMEG